MTFRLKDLETLTAHDVPEERIHALWRGAEARAVARRRKSKMPAALGVIALGVIALAGAAARLLATESEPPAFLALAGGGVPGAVDAAGEVVRVELADGSCVLVAPGARWVPTDNRPGHFESEVDRGRVTFDVRPGGARRWVIRAGTTMVEVLGTRFVVERAGPRTTVRVSRGQVRVSDPRAPASLRAELSTHVLLRSGGSVTFDVPVANVPIANEPIAHEPIAHEPVADAIAAPTAPDPPEPASSDLPHAGSRWRGLATRGDHRGAYRALGARGVLNAARGADAEQLMLLADVARLSGHPADAVVPLERLIREMPGDPRAPIAAVLLGRILMDDLRRPAGARDAFERALALGVPPPLMPDVERRLTELRSGER